MHPKSGPFESTLAGRFLDRVDRPVPPPQEPPPDDFRIMIVDDVPMMIMVVRAHLEKAGFQNVVTVTDSRLAVATLTQERPDLLLLDLMMPNVSGLDVLQSLRAIPEFEALPVLILTGSDDDDLKRAAREAGATDILSKPIDRNELIPRVQDALALCSESGRSEAPV